MIGNKRYVDLDNNVHRQLLPPPPMGVNTSTPLFVCSGHSDSIVSILILDTSLKRELNVIDAPTTVDGRLQLVSSQSQISFARTPWHWRRKASFMNPQDNT